MYTLASATSELNSKLPMGTQPGEHTHIVLSYSIATNLPTCLPIREKEQIEITETRPSHRQTTKPTMWCFTVDRKFGVGHVFRQGPSRDDSEILDTY